MSEQQATEKVAPTYDELVEHVRYLSTTVDLLRQVVGACLPAHMTDHYAHDLRQIDDEYRRRRGQLSCLTPPESSAR